MDFLSAAVGILIGSIATYYVQRKSKRDELIFNEYSKYLNKMDHLASLAGIDFEHNLMPAFFEFGKKVIDEPHNAPRLVIEHNQNILNILSSARQLFRDANSEFSGLRLIGSDKVLILLDDFKDKSKMVFDISMKFIGSEPAVISSDLDTHLKDLKLLGDDIKELASKIEKQMRKEIL